MPISTAVSAASVASNKRVRASLAAVALAFIALAVLYWSYVERRTDYLVERDLRLLSAATAQLDARLESRKQAVRNFAEAAFWCDGTRPVMHYPSEGAKSLTEYLPDFLEVRRG